MINGVILKQLNSHLDGRGWLLEVWRSDESDHLPAMGYVSLTKPGVVRGPHEHLYQADFFVFLSGSWKVTLWDNREPSITSEVMFIERPSSLLVPAGVVHAYQNVGLSEGLVLNLPDQLYAGEGRLGAVDEIRHESDPDSVFRV